MTTILEEPYMMLRKTKTGAPPLRGNDRYEGYCKVRHCTIVLYCYSPPPSHCTSVLDSTVHNPPQDLADLITRLTGIRFRIQPVADSKYGSPDTSVIGGWNGRQGRGGREGN